MPKTNTTKTPKKVNYTYAIGRRKEASARARLIKGKGETMVNAVPATKYFPGELNAVLLMRPFTLTKTEDKFYATIKVSGGGMNSQRDAAILAMARALEKVKKEEHRPLLKKAGLLTRDGRNKERRKVGTGGKARRKKQSPKR